MTRDRKLYVVAYDIPDDKRRAKVYNLLSAYGEWTQYSLFELFLTGKQRVALFDKLRAILQESQDSVRLYPLCDADRRQVITLGSKPPQEKKEYII